MQGPVVFGAVMVVVFSMKSIAINGLYVMNGESMKSLSQETNCEDSNCDWTQLLGLHAHDLWDYGHGDIRDMVICYPYHLKDSDDY